MKILFIFYITKIFIFNLQLCMKQKSLFCYHEEIMCFFEIVSFKIEK